MILSVLQGVGVVAGVTGAVFVSGESQHSRRIGFGIWILGNASWIVAAILMQNLFMIAMFGFYFITALLGASSNTPYEQEMA